MAKATEFWAKVLGMVGYEPQQNLVTMQIFGKAAHCPSFAIAQGEKGGTSALQLQVEDSEEVEEVYRKAIAVGAKEVSNLNWVDDGDRFAAKFEDIDGYVVEVYCKETYAEECNGNP